VAVEADSTAAVVAVVVLPTVVAVLPMVEVVAALTVAADITNSNIL